MKQKRIGLLAGMVYAQFQSAKPVRHTKRGSTNEHGGGGLFAYDEEIMGWLLPH